MMNTQVNRTKPLKKLRNRIASLDVDVVDDAVDDDLKSLLNGLSQKRLPMTTMTTMMTA
jgi:hypothetical protein